MAACCRWVAGGENGEMGGGEGECRLRMRWRCLVVEGCERWGVGVVWMWCGVYVGRKWGAAKTAEPA